MSTKTVISTLIVWLVVTLLTSSVRGYPTGAPFYSCVGMKPGHSGAAQNLTTLPYNIVLNPSIATPGEFVTVTVTGPEIRGLLSTVQDERGDFVTGFVPAPDNTLKLVNCGTSTITAVPGSGLTHAQRLASTNLSFRWQVPVTAGSMYNIRVTVVQDYFTFWVDVDNILRVDSRPAQPNRPSPAQPNGPSPAQPNGPSPAQPNTPDMTSSNTGSGAFNSGRGTPNTGSASREPISPPQRTNSNNGGSSIRNTQQARVGNAPTATMAQNTNMVNGGLGSLPRENTNTLSEGRRRVNGWRGRGNGRRGQRGGLSAWLSAWFDA